MECRDELFLLHRRLDQLGLNISQGQPHLYFILKREHAMSQCDNQIITGNKALHSITSQKNGLLNSLLKEAAKFKSAQYSQILYFQAPPTAV